MIHSPGPLPEPHFHNASVAEPSRLPGWSRGHVLAHLARNADALVN
ncbi:maleylpyruvate isomerase N-terminal domain-containing protein, partial [Streptomyces prunicolor]